MTPSPPPRPPAQVLEEVERLLQGIAVFPRDWPTARHVERALLADVHEFGEESAWAGGTLAAAKCIAGLPRLLRELSAIVRGQEEELALIREAARDATLSDGAARVVAGGLDEPTSEDIKWATAVLAKSAQPTPEDSR